MFKGKYIKIPSKIEPTGFNCAGIKGCRPAADSF